MGEGGFRAKLFKAGCLLLILAILAAAVLVAGYAWRSYRDHLEDT